MAVKTLYHYRNSIDPNTQIPKGKYKLCVKELPTFDNYLFITSTSDPSTCVQEITIQVSPTEWISINPRYQRSLCTNTSNFDLKRVEPLHMTDILSVNLFGASNYVAILPESKYQLLLDLIENNFPRIRSRFSTAKIGLVLSIKQADEKSANDILQKFNI